jgi:hypothetical protein
MPQTLPKAIKILGFLEENKVFPVTMLVVPGMSWPAADIRILKSLQDSGYELAGHGWKHQAEMIHCKRHRIHAKLISRSEAEHLSLSPEKIASIINDCYHWFESAGLNSPSLYVPPAWAMGNLSKKTLKALPFRFYETQTGIYDSDAGVFYPLPVAGYMADNRFRTQVLKVTNLICRLPFFNLFRIAIHPYDMDLPLENHLKKHLRTCRGFSNTCHLGNT